MKKSTLFNRILDAVIVLEVVLLAIILKPFSGSRENEEAVIVPDQELTIAEQEETSQPPVVGNSKPVDVEPVEGIRITAPANALDKDREFKITAVDEKTWEETEKTLAEVSDEQMLFCFDLDAGMKPDEVLPGEYSLSIDLEKMGIPSILHDKISVWRQGENGLEKYTSWVKDGKLCYCSDKNSITLASLAIGSGLVTLGALGIDYLPKRFLYIADMYGSYFKKREDFTCYEVKDSYGNFNVCFRFKDSEYGDRFEAFKTSFKDYENRLKELEKKADEEVERRTKEAYRKETEDLNSFQLLFKSKSIENRCRRAIDRAAILAKYCDEDEPLKHYKEMQALPPSVLDIGEELKLANRFLTDDQKLIPQHWTLDVFLLPDGTPINNANGVLIAPYLKSYYVCLNYQKIRKQIPYKRKGEGESMLLTITHELFHYRHKKSRWVKEDDFRTEESIAGYLENAAALYFLKKGEIQTSPANYAKTFLTGHFEGGAGFDPAPRENHEVFARDFNANTTIPNEAYTYADLMEYLTIKRKLPENLKAGDLLEKYSYLSSHKTNYMKWFDTTDEKVFNGYVQSFCEDTLSRIYFRQDANEVRSSTPDLALEELQVSRKDPVKEMKTKKGHLIMRCFNLSSQDAKTEGPFNAFIVRGNACTPEEVSFYTSSDMFKKEKNKMEYFSGDKTAYQGAYFKPNSSALPFKIVALFAPEKPVIKKVKKNYIVFKVPDPGKEFKKNGYVTGALFSLKTKDGDEKTILAPENKFGKEVKWALDEIGTKDFSLTVRWVSQQRSDLVCESPESEPATHGAVATAYANTVGDEKTAANQKEKTPKTEKKKVKKEAAQESVQDSEGKLSLHTKFGTDAITLLEFSYRPHMSTKDEHHADTGVNTPDYKNPMIVVNQVFMLGGDQGKVELIPQGDEYRLHASYSGTIMKKFFLNEPCGNLPEQEHDIDINIVLNEDLVPLSGSVYHKAKCQVRVFEQVHSYTYEVSYSFAINQNRMAGEYQYQHPFPWSESTRENKKYYYKSFRLYNNTSDDTKNDFIPQNMNSKTTSVEGWSDWINSKWSNRLLHPTWNLDTVDYIRIEMYTDKTEKYEVFSANQ